MYLKSTARRSIIVLSLTLVAALCGYFFRILLAKNFTVAEYGLFYSIFAFLSLFVTFVDLGFMQAVAKNIVEQRLSNNLEKIKSALMFSSAYQFGVSILLAIAFVLIIPFFYEKLFHTQNTLIFFLMLIWFVTLPIDMFFKTFFLGFQKVVAHSSIDPLKIIFVVIFTWLFIHFGFGILSPFIAYAAINIIIFFIFLLPAHKAFPNFISIPFKYDKKLFSHIFSYSVLLASAGFAWAILTYTDTIMITIFRNTTEVGLYQVAMPLANTLLYVVGAINVVAYPLFAQFSAKQESHHIKSGVTLLYNYLFIGMLPLALALFSFPELVITLLFGVDYLPATTALRILSFSALFFSLASFNTTLLSATGHAKKTAFFAFLTAVLNFILNLALIPLFGFVGASIATAASFFFLLIFTLREISTMHSIKLPIKDWTLNFIVAGFVIFIIWSIKAALEFNPWVELAIIGTLAAIIYASLLILLKVLNIKELRELIFTVLRR